jgi:large subunit ribosomal protein L11
MAKEIKAIIKLQCPAGKANPAPPVGPALGQHGVNIMEFCNTFNEKTRELGDTVIPVEITVYEDRGFSLIFMQPPAAILLKKAAGVEKGSGSAKKEKVGKISKEKLRELAEKKLPDLNAKNTEAAMKIIQGTAKNMGIEIS